jgi:hypothetical protein
LPPASCRFYSWPFTLKMEAVCSQQNVSRRLPNSTEDNTLDRFCVPLQSHLVVPEDKSSTFMWNCDGLLKTTQYYSLEQVTTNFSLRVSWWTSLWSAKCRYNMKTTLWARLWKAIECCSDIWTIWNSNIGYSHTAWLNS